MNPKNREVILLKLSEHDASQLLALIRREMGREDKIWQPYWERLAQIVERSLEHASFCYLQHHHSMHSQDS